MSSARWMDGLVDEFALPGHAPVMLLSLVGFGLARLAGVDHRAWALALGLWVGYCGAYGLIALACRYRRRLGAYLLPLLALCTAAGAGLGYGIEQQWLSTPMNEAARWTRGFLHLAFCGVLVGTPVGQAAWRHRVLRQTEAEKVRILSELQFLQAQIEPHFLFNTLATLRSLVRQQSNKALPLLDHISGFLEAVLPQVRAAQSNLGRELHIVEQYLAIMALRMEPRLQYRIETAPGLDALPLPALLLQPLVENAVVHGIEPCEAGGQILVQATVSGDRLCLRVLNSGSPLGAAPQRGGSGLALRNLRQRLRTLHSGAAAFELRSTTEGTEALLSFPLLSPATS